MKKHPHFWILWLLLFWINNLFLPDTVFAGNVKFIINKNNSETHLNTIKVQKIFLGKERRWNNKKEIKLIVQLDADCHNEFLKKYIKKNTLQFRAYWRNRLFTGKGGVPIYTKNPETTLKYVNDIEGAIGYLPENYVISDDSNIQIVKIID